MLLRIWELGATFIKHHRVCQYAYASQYLQKYMPPDVWLMLARSLLQVSSVRDWPALYLSQVLKFVKVSRATRRFDIGTPTTVCVNLPMVCLNVHVGILVAVISVQTSIFNLQPAGGGCFS